MDENTSKVKVHSPFVFPKDAQITEPCPSCQHEGVLISRVLAHPVTHVVVCKGCRIHLSPEVSTADEAIHWWNTHSINWDKVKDIGWLKWRALMPNDDERKTLLPARNIVRMPDLTNYRGVCPVCQGRKPEKDAPACEHCGGEGVVGFDKKDD